MTTIDAIWAWRAAKERESRAEAAYNAAFESAVDAFRREHHALFDELLRARDAVAEAERRLSAENAPLQQAESPGRDGTH